MFMSPGSGLPEKLYFHIYQGQNDWAKPQRMGSISGPRTHCTSAELKKITKKNIMKTKDKNM